MSSTPLKQITTHQPVKNAIISRLKPTPSQNSKHTSSKDQQGPTQWPQEDMLILETIQQYQSQQDPGYFRFQGWIQYNQQLFNHVNGHILLDLWKIMRVINMGEVCIPNGLIYDLSILFTTLIRYPNTNKSISSVFNNFLRMNQSDLSLNHFKQIQQYTSLQDIQQVYCPRFEQQQRKKPLGEGLGSMMQRMNRAQQQHQHKIKQKRFETLADQLKQCSFKPTINTYHSACKPQPRVRPQPALYSHIYLHIQQSQQQPVFKARPFNASVFDSNQLSLIPGVKQFVHRQACSQSQKQRIRRYNAKASNR